MAGPLARGRLSLASAHHDAVRDLQSQFGADICSGRRLYLHNGHLLRAQRRWVCVEFMALSFMDGEWRWVFMVRYDDGQIWMVIRSLFSQNDAQLWRHRKRVLPQLYFLNVLHQSMSPF